MPLQHKTVSSYILRYFSVLKLSEFSWNGRNNEGDKQLGKPLLHSEVFIGTTVILNEPVRVSYRVSNPTLEINFQSSGPTMVMTAIIAL